MKGMTRFSCAIYGLFLLLNECSNQSLSQARMTKPCKGLPWESLTWPCIVNEEGCFAIISQLKGLKKKMFVKSFVNDNYIKHFVPSLIPLIADDPARVQGMETAQS